MSAGQTGHMTGQMGHVQGTDGTQTRGCPAKILYVCSFFSFPKKKGLLLNFPAVILAAGVILKEDLQSPLLGEEAMWEARDRLGARVLGSQELRRGNGRQSLVKNEMILNVSLRILTSLSVFLEIPCILKTKNLKVRRKGLRLPDSALQPRSLFLSTF